MVELLIDALAVGDVVGFLYYLFLGDVPRATLFAVVFVILVLMASK